jgi:hypothetical protein
MSLYHGKNNKALAVTPPIERAKSFSKQVKEHQSKSATFKSVHELDVLDFRNTVPLLRGRPSKEDLLDSGRFDTRVNNTTPDHGDDTLISNMRDNSEGSVVTARQPQQETNSMSEDAIKTVYHDTTNEMQSFPTSTLRWDDDMVVIDRVNTKKKTVYENRQKQKQKKQLLQRQDNNHDSHNADDGPRADYTEQTNHTMAVQSDTSNSSLGCRGQKLNSSSSLYFDVILNPTTKEHSATEQTTMIVLPEGPRMLRRGRSSSTLTSDFGDSMMYFGTLVSDGYEAHGADTLYYYLMERVPPEPRSGLSISFSSFCLFPVALAALPLMLLAVVVKWSKAQHHNLKREKKSNTTSIE